MGRLQTHNIVPKRLNLEKLIELRVKWVDQVATRARQKLPASLLGLGQRQGHSVPFSLRQQEQRGSERLK